MSLSGSMIGASIAAAVRAMIARRASLADGGEARG
jgi:hypothetical protein